MTNKSVSFAEARKWYPVDDPVHGFDHVMRVCRLAQAISRAEGADERIVLTAVLLHDAQYYLNDEDVEDVHQSHHLRSAIFAEQVLTKKGWTAPQIDAVQHCIRSHRFRDESERPSTIEAMVLFDADKLDAIGAIGVARAVAYAARADQPAYYQPSEQFITEGKCESGEPHSAYHEHLFKLSRIKERMFTGTGQKIAEERHTFMCLFFDRLIQEVDGVI